MSGKQEGYPKGYPDIVPELPTLLEHIAGCVVKISTSVKEKVRLEEAMTMDLGEEYKIRGWSILGNYINNYVVPDGYEAKRTCVTYSPHHGKFTVVVHLKYVDGDITVIPCETLSSIEELKEKYPNLFDLEGELLAINF
jgi:hypothetical protein